MSANSCGELERLPPTENLSDNSRAGHSIKCDNQKRHYGFLWKTLHFRKTWREKEWFCNDISFSRSGDSTITTSSLTKFNQITINPYAVK